MRGGWGIGGGATAPAPRGHHQGVTHMFETLNRRAFLGRSGAGLGAIAPASNLQAKEADKKTDRWPGVVRPLHTPAKAKRIIWLYMAGGMSHLETFDPKPKLAAMDGKPMPESFTKGQPIAQLQGNKALK